MNMMLVAKGTLYIGRLRKSRVLVGLYGLLISCIDDRAGMHVADRNRRTRQGTLMP